MSPKPILGHFVLFRRWSGGGGGDKEGLWDGRLESEDELVVEGGRKSSSESLPEGEYGIWGESCDDDDDDDGEEGGPVEVSWAARRRTKTKGGEMAEG